MLHNCGVGLLDVFTCVEAKIITGTVTEFSMLPPTVSVSHYTMLEESWRYCKLCVHHATYLTHTHSKW